MTGMKLYGGISGVLQSRAFYLSSVYCGVKHIIIREALHLSCGFFNICVIYFTTKSSIFLKKEISEKAT